MDSYCTLRLYIEPIYVSKMNELSVFEYTIDLIYVLGAYLCILNLSLYWLPYRKCMVGQKKCR